ncbi:YlbD family protein [Ornithinibacillus bavariensis]|uniref:Coat protein n=1 Tax=Ornithinibacillus bavariensis TaxID=545502 RepID=A0A919X5R3_9BACI|nr:YlbD family protein [Ornithinibacillus bavariensis]GIO26041.1 hypothetical protein J43TS3_06520 [Ornithinibacillus bavariensis]HAM82133.1 hypothetical protein [Ornithinibacillus sp.]
MSDNQLHPTVRQFRDFINRHPSLRKEIRRTGRTWQEYYEKWSLLGEDDEFWDVYKKDSSEEKTTKKDDSKADLFKQLVKLTENIDIEKVQKQIHQLSGTISTVQELIDQYQGSKGGARPMNNRQPFGWGRD